jgi:Sec-independent protein translocase protein TatA
MRQLKSTQSGISFFGLLIVMVVLALLGVLGAQALPTVIEYQAVLKAINKAANEGSTVPTVKASFDKAAEIDNITSITGKDLSVTKDGDKTLVSFAYNKEIHMFGPAYLLLKYQGQARSK